jgi:hypothetical protein
VLSSVAPPLKASGEQPPAKQEAPERLIHLAARCDKRSPPVIGLIEKPIQLRRRGSEPTPDFTT